MATLGRLRKRHCMRAMPACMRSAYVAQKHGTIGSPVNYNARLRQLRTVDVSAHCAFRVCCVSKAYLTPYTEASLTYRAVRAVLLLGVQLPAMRTQMQMCTRAGT